jgi:hypothetical protein
VKATIPPARSPRERGLATIAALGLLAALAVETRARSQPSDVASHHEHIRRVAQTAIPYSVGDWIGRDVEASPSAVALLRPNVLVERVYENARTGERANLLFVQCSDARDLIGHYPPKCYPAHGWTLKSAQARSWAIDGTTIGGMRYRFERDAASADAAMVVDNFMVLPTGRFGRDMDAVDDVARDVRLRRLGAAEVQVVTDVTATEERRDEVVRELVAATAPLIASVGDTERHE